MKIDNITYAISLARTFVGECYALTDDVFITNILESTAGCDPLDSDIVLYRPWYAAAYFLYSLRPRGGIIAAQGTDGVQWEAIDNQINKLLELQKINDCKLGCIDPCYQADNLLNPNLHCFSGFMI